MKNKVIQIASLFVLSLVVSLSVSAQMSASYRGEVPFDFSVAGKSFAAGEYRIERANPQSQNGLIVIRSMKTRKAFVFNTLQSGKLGRESTSNLVFHNIRGEYVLARISSPTLNAAFGTGNKEKWLAQKTTVALKPAK